MKKMKTIFKLITFILLVLLIKTGTAQHLTTYNLYSQSRFLFSPANTGDVGMAFVDVRNQWVGISQAPEDITFGISSTIGEARKSGLGLMIQRDKRGVLRRTSGSLNYSYRAYLNEKHHLIFGLGAGIVDNRIDRDDVRAVEGHESEIYERIGSSDYGVRFGARFGINYEWDNKLRIGFAMPELFEDEDYKFKQHFLGIASYKLYVIREKLEIEPSVLFQNYAYNDYSVNQFDANLYACWNQTIWAGFTYRNNPSYIFSAGVNLYNVGVGYAYEYSAEDEITPFGGTHEIMVSYYFDKDRKDKLNEELLNNNQLEQLMEDSAAMTDDDYQDQIDSLRREIETLKMLLNVKDLKDWADQFKDKIDDYNDQIIELEKEKVGDGLVKPVYFDIDKYNIKPEYYEQLNKVADMVKNKNMKVELVGHADDTGPYEYNQKLSENRANEVFQYLVKKGCPENNFIVVGKGETVPAETNQTPEGRQLNRRVEIRRAE